MADETPPTWVYQAPGARKVTDEDNTVRLIQAEAFALAHSALELASAVEEGRPDSVPTGVYESFAATTARRAGELLALSNHLKSKLEKPAELPPWLKDADPADKSAEAAVVAVEKGFITIDDARIALGLKPLTPVVKPRTRKKAV